MVNQWLNKAQEWCLPARCVLCGRPGHEGRDLCAACLVDLPRHQAVCRHCGVPLPVAGVCGQCQQAPPPFERVLSSFAYREPLAYLVQQFKFSKKLSLARLLGQLMADDVAAQLQGLPDVIVPVPLHRSRLQERGFNQAVELARPLARRLQCRVAYEGCRRIRPTAVQSLLAAEERRRNVRGAFEVLQSVKSQHIAIVDDVMTTGHTVAELARTLRRAGAARVEVWVLARAAALK